MKPRHHIDGMLICHPNGGAFVIFDPRWWRIDRWVWWFVVLPFRNAWRRYVAKVDEHGRKAAIVERGRIDVAGRIVHAYPTDFRPPRVPERKT